VLKEPGLSFVTPPLSRDLHLLGHPLLDLQVSATTPDADLFAYLEVIEPDGNARIVSSGRLRASHRRENTPDLDYMEIPYHRGNRADAEPLVPGQAVRMRFDLLPTSTVVKAGRRLRLSFAGADPRQRFRTVSFDPPPVISIHNLPDMASKFRLPVVERAQFVVTGGSAP